MAFKAYATGQHIIPDDAGGAGKQSYFRQLAQFKGIPATFKAPAAALARTVTQSVTKMGAPLVKAVVKGFDTFVAQRPGELTIKTKLGNTVPKSMNEEYNRVLGEFAWRHRIADHKMVEIGDAIERLYALEVGADHATAGPGGVIEHNGERYSKANVDRYRQVMQRVQRAHGVSDDEMHALSNRLEAMGKQLRPLVIRRAPPKADRLYGKNAA